MNVSIDGLRKNILWSLEDVLNDIKPLVESYKNEDYEPKLLRYEAADLFNSINELRSMVGVMMCCYEESIGMSNLSDLADKLSWLEYESEMNDE